MTVAVGGDNALTVPAALGSFGDQLSTAGLITLDAHHDLRDCISNGSPVRRLIEAGLEGRRVVQIGIADFANSAAYSRRAEEYGITIVNRDALHHRPLDDLMAEALEIAGAGGGPIHVDLDVDVCDRSVAPGCPASIPGGLAAWELRRFARLAGASAPAAAGTRPLAAPNEFQVGHRTGYFADQPRIERNPSTKASRPQTSTKWMPHPRAARVGNHQL